MIAQPGTFDLRHKIGTKSQGDDLSHLNATDLRRKIGTNNQCAPEETYLREGLISQNQGIWENDSIND